MLAAATADGRVTVFKFNPPSKEGEPVLDFAKCWEPEPTFHVRGGGGGGGGRLDLEWVGGAGQGWHAVGWGVAKGEDGNPTPQPLTCV